MTLTSQREGTVQVPGGNVWYKIEGDGPGTPLLLLHGGPGAGSTPNCSATTRRPSTTTTTKPGVQGTTTTTLAPPAPPPTDPVLPPPSSGPVVNAPSPVANGEPSDGGGSSPPDEGDDTLVALPPLTTPDAAPPISPIPGAEELFGDGEGVPLSMALVIAVAGLATVALVLRGTFGRGRMPLPVAEESDTLKFR